MSKEDKIKIKEMAGACKHVVKDLHHCCICIRSIFYHLQLFLFIRYTLYFNTAQFPKAVCYQTVEQVCLSECLV